MFNKAQFSIKFLALPLLFATILMVSACAETEDSNTTQQEVIQPMSALNADVFHVRTTKVSAGNQISSSIQASGTVVSKTSAQPSFKTGGILTQVTVEQGDVVRKGQLIATINATEFKAGLAQAEAALEKAERDLGRVEALFADSVATSSQRDDAATGVKVAQKRVEQVEFNTSTTRINAPFAGKVIRKLHNTGETVGPGMPVVVIQGTGRDDWRVRTALTDREWAQVSIGDTAKVSFDGFPGEIFDAYVTDRASSANVSGGTFDVELSLKQQPSSLATGLIASIELTLPSRKDAERDYSLRSGTKSKASSKTESSPATYTIPLAALARVNGKRAEVFVLAADSTVATREVQLGSFDASTATILAGLTGDEELITTGATWLRSGDRVVVNH